MMNLNRKLFTSLHVKHSNEIASQTDLKIYGDILIKIFRPIRNHINNQVRRNIGYEIDEKS